MISNSIPILYVEDDRAVRGLFSEELSDDGYDIIEPMLKPGNFSVDVDSMLDGSSPKPALAIVDVRIMHGKTILWPPDIAFVTELTHNGIPAVITTADPDAHSILEEFGIRSFLKPINIRKEGEDSFVHALKGARDDPETAVVDMSTLPYT